MSAALFRFCVIPLLPSGYIPAVYLIITVKNTLMKLSVTSISKFFSVKLIAAVLAVVACAVPFSASAQRGEKTLGVMGGFSSYNDGGFADVYFQYTFVDHVRGAFDLGYVFRNEGKSAFVCDVDVHFPFRIVKGLGVYPLVGFTFNNWNYGDDHNAARAGANFGAGFDIYLTSNLKMTLQGKYSVMNDTSGAFFGLGLGYVF